MILKLQPPDDEVALTLISGQVVQPQPAASRRRRAEAANVATVVSKGSPLASWWGLCLQGVSGAISVIAVAGDVVDAFTRWKIQSFFLVGITIACCAPVGPHIIVPERKGLPYFQLDYSQLWYF